MPVWLRDPGAWIAIGISLLFLVVAFVMHRIVLRVLKGDEVPLSSAPHHQPDQAKSPAKND
jgi:hypothetical protein